jgi:hypothetical protein
MAHTATPTPLEKETRPTVDTAAAAHYLHLSEQYLRKWAATETGPIRPHRVPGCRGLHWPVSEIRKLLGVSA